MATIPAIGITRWAINADGDIYNLDGYVGAGTDVPNEMLTAAGALSLAFSSEPGPTPGFGKIYVGEDGLLHYKDADGAGSYILTNGSSIDIGELHDVLITAVATDDILHYNGTYWENIPFPTTVPSGVAGAVQYSDGSGNFASDNTNFHWDTVNHILQLSSITVSGAGTNSERYGAGTIANGDYSVALGNLATTNGGNYGVAIGHTALAYGNYAIAIGENAQSAGSSGGAICIGTNTVGTGTYATAIGVSASSSGLYASALGPYCATTANYALAIGNSAAATTTNAIAIGRSPSSAGQSSIAIGTSATIVSGHDYSVALGASAATIRPNNGQWGSTTYPLDFCMYSDMGIGTTYPHEALTINGIISLQEQDNYNRIHDGYGSIWAKSDGTVHFTNDGGTDYDLTAPSAVGPSGAVQYSDGAGGVSSDDTNFHWDTVNTRLQLSGITVPGGAGLQSEQFGDGAKAGSRTISIGYHANSIYPTSTDNVVIGWTTYARYNQNIVIGRSTSALWNYGVAVGYSAQVNEQAVAVGALSLAGYYSTTIGAATTASGNYSIAVGFNATTVGNYDGQWGAASYPTNFAMYGNASIGGTTQNERLTIEGIISLQEQASYSSTYAGYGSLWVKSDGTIHFTNDSGTDYNLTGGVPEITFQENKAYWDEAIYQLRIAADGYTGSAGGGVPEITFQENKAYWDEAIHHLTTAADGYLGATEAYDGYVAFFTGSTAVAGDNDLFWDRVNNQLQVSSIQYKTQVTPPAPTTSTPAGTTQEIDWALGPIQTLDIGSASGNVTLTLVNAIASATYVLKIIQDATTPLDVVWPANVLWPGGTAPVISTGASAVDIVTLLYDGADYYGNFGQNYQ